MRLLAYGGVIMVLLSCSKHDVDEKNLCEKSTLGISLDSVLLASSCSTPDGAIYVSAQGGVGPYTYSLNAMAAQAIDSFSGLSSGIYSITVSDKNGCTSSLDNIAVLAKGFKFVAAIAEDTECLSNNGSVTINVEEGSAPFTYKIGDGNVSTTNTFNNLPPGKYVIEVIDAQSCTVKLSVTVPRGSSGTSWSTDILPIIKTSCAVTGCHDGKTRIDYRLYSNAKQNAADIKSNTIDKSMPFDGTPLTQDQINLISCWVDDGALEN